MKIIKQGILPSAVMNGTCKKCGTEVECEKRESTRVEIERSDVESIIGRVDYIIACPLSGCGYPIYVAPKLQQLGSSQCHQLLTKLHDVGLTSEEKNKLKEVLARIFDTLNEEVVD